MVEEDRLREWVQKKLDAGVDPSRIKKSLEETDHDPSIVDTVQDPFNSEDSGGDFEDKDMPSIDGEKRSEEETGSGGEDRSPEDSDTLNSGIGPESLEERDDSVGADEEKDDSAGDGGFTLPSLSIPELPVWPALVMAVLLVGFVGYMFVPWSSVGMGGLPSISAPSVDLPGSGNGTVEGQQDEGCPDVGVRINSVSASSGSTTAEVLVTRNDAEVVLEVYDSGQLMGSTTKNLEGSSTISVDASGDRVLFRPTGCKKYEDSMDIE